MRPVFLGAALAVFWQVVDALVSRGALLSLTALPATVSGIAGGGIAG